MSSKSAATGGDNALAPNTDETAPVGEIAASMTMALRTPNGAV
jgi:hypothetical protein